MIAVRLWGGLGNQMFQYALAHHLALKHDTRLVLDLGWFKYRPPGAATARHYELGPFSLDRDVGKRTYRPAGTGSVFPWRRAPRIPVVKERDAAFDSAVLSSPDDVWLHGYWQSERYFAEVEPQIRKAFGFSRDADERNGSLLRAIRGANSVSLHVRRGDYVTDPKISKVLSAAPLEYYRAAVGEIAARVESPTFYVFSDDPEWSRENISIGHPATYVSHNTGRSSFEDMRLMARCRHHIIANSSFSWWGAWLGEDKGKLVIAPKLWFADESKDTRDLIPERWIQL